MRAGLNGNRHGAFDVEGRLAAMGVTYEGAGDWTLPAGASVANLDGDDWLLTLADGSEWQVWSDEAD